MNARLYQFRYSRIPSIVDLYLQITYGSMGAPTVNFGGGVASVSRTSAGLYVIHLQDSFQRLIDASDCQILASGSPAAPQFWVVQDNSSSGSAPSITVQFAAAGSATDPASGEVSLIKLSFKNSSATPF